MNILKKCVAALIAASIVGPMLLASGPLQAQNTGEYRESRDSRGQSPRIDGFNVEEVRRLDPGVELDFTLYGTPGGRASLQVSGAQRALALVETNAGQYEGTYTISRRDRLQARSTVTANLRVGNQVTSSVLNEPLLIGVGSHNNTGASGPMPRIERFTVQPSGDLSAGNELQFLVSGTPGAKVALVIAGARGKFFLPEQRAGEYSALYRIRNSDRLTPNSEVTATMTAGERVSSMKLAQSLQSQNAPVQRACLNCGTVEAVNLIEVQGEGTYLGAIGGGLAGALLGRQVGGGSGRTAAQIVGALGGAYAGRAIEGNMKDGQHMEVVVRLENGATQTVEFPGESGFRVGDRVSVANGALTRLP